jgi:hypothetical protein
MHWTGWLVVLLAAMTQGWMAYDGAHALLRGDYVTPKSGQYAGQLGPWAKVVSAAGIEPRSTLMKIIFVAYGGVTLLIAIGFILGFKWAWWGMLVAAILGLWYLPFGTLLNIIMIVLLLLPPLRMR